MLNIPVCAACSTSEVFRIVDASWAIVEKLHTSSVSWNITFPVE